MLWPLDSVVGWGCWLWPLVERNHYKGSAVPSGWMRSQAAFPDRVVPLSVLHTWAQLQAGGGGSIISPAGISGYLLGPHGAAGWIPCSGRAAAGCQGLRPGSWSAGPKAILSSWRGLHICFPAGAGHRGCIIGQGAGN